MERRVETGYYGRVLRDFRIFYPGSFRYDMLSILQHAQKDENGEASFLLMLDRFGGRVYPEIFYGVCDSRQESEESLILWRNGRYDVDGE